MALSELPDELLMKVLNKLLVPDHYLQTDYLRLALTCKRFYYIAVKRFDLIKSDRPETNEILSVHVHIIDKDSKFQKKYPQMYKIYCKAHSNSWYDECFERSLSVALSFKLATTTAICIVDYDLEDHNCLDSIDNSRLDNIRELVILRCKLSTRTLGSLLMKFKNLLGLRLLENHHECASWHRESMPNRTIKLNHLYLSGECNMLPTSSMQISTKRLILCKTPNLCLYYQRVTFDYIDKLLGKFETIRLDVFRSSVWKEVAAIKGIQDIPCEILDDLDKRSPPAEAIEDQIDDPILYLPGRFTRRRDDIRFRD